MPETPVAGQVWRHVKTDGLYVIIALARMQDADPALDYRTVVVYRGVNQANVWVRSLLEFTDGRFEYVRSRQEPVPVIDRAEVRQKLEHHIEEALKLADTAREVLAELADAAKEGL